MGIKKETINEVEIFTISGKLNTNTSNDVEKQLDEEIQDFSKSIIMNLSELDYVSSSGLRIFLKYAKKSKERQGTYILCGLSDEIQDVFDMIGFSGIIKICKDQQIALDEIK